MAEDSQPWGGTVTGDAGPYSDDNWSDMYVSLFQIDRTVQGVFADQLNMLVVTGAPSPISVASGRGLNDGKWYENTAAVAIVIPTPTPGNSRIDRIVLRKDWTAQTVRIARVAGVEAAGPVAPALTQADGTTWEIPLAQLTITDAGAISYAPDQRDFIDHVLDVLEVWAYEGMTP